ncbi:SURF1 family protein [Alkalimarinus coralli]|uniref:SURF1 family protein n=1 Tax=Alkalimarinus coralli TaxID=2935863 RepID=UPI00202BA25B|nr:SURF1 family protein [Alkalimarinus coralli]
MARTKRYSKGTVALVLFAAVMTPILAGLGIWQLNRADEKYATVQQQITGDKASSRQLSDFTVQGWKNQTQGSQWNYKKISAFGQYDETAYLLLDNRTRNGRVGYEVLHLFRTDDGRSLLVNRGWIEAPPYRDQWPVVPAVKGRVDINGTIYLKREMDFTLAEKKTTQHWPRRVQSLDMSALEAELNSDLYPFVLRLADDSQPGALKTGWNTVTISPEKHVGYAVQWFSLALVLVVMTVIAIRKNNMIEVRQADER